MHVMRIYSCIQMEGELKTVSVLHIHRMSNWMFGRDHQHRAQSEPKYSQIQHHISSSLTRITTN